MKIIQRSLNLGKVDYHIKHLSILNILIPINLTDKEIEVLATFMSLDKELIDEDMFNSVSRKKVMSKLKLSPGGLSNYIRFMLDKKVLFKTETGKLKIREYLLPENKAQGYQIKVILDENIN